MDDADLASVREEEQISRALKAAQQKMTHNTAIPTEPVDCDDCGEEIPRKRLEAVPGATRCITCQGAAERR